MSNMTYKQKQTSLTLILILSLACNLPGLTAQPTLSVDDEAATIIAQTLQAQVMNGGDVPITATFSPIPQATSTTGPTATITPTYSVPMLTLREPTNCRLGPGQDYEVLFSYVKGVKLEIIGAYPQLNYWLVKSAESETGECWLWGEYADITGSYWVVPSVTPPPTQTMTLPQAPAVKWEFNCDYAVSQLTTTFTWTDYAVNETGYRIIRNDQAIIELPANTTAYTDAYAFTTGEKIIYQIEVYNVTGFTRSAAIPITC
jgi:SH3-like domain-containing protein